MKKQTIQEYLDLHYPHNQPQVKFVKIDYSKICTVSQLIKWAYSTFSLPRDQGQITSDTTECLWLVFRTVGQRFNPYIVLESYTRHMTSEVKFVLEGNKGWKHHLGFGLWRDYGINVAFFQDPETKGKRPHKKT